MKFGTISISKSDGRWEARIDNEIDSCSGLGDTLAEAFKHLAGVVDSGGAETMGARLLAWEAFNAGWDAEPAAVESRTEQFSAWWSRR